MSGVGHLEALELLSKECAGKVCLCNKVFQTFIVSFLTRLTANLENSVVIAANPCKRSWKSSQEPFLLMKTRTVSLCDSLTLSPTLTFKSGPN